MPFIVVTVWWAFCCMRFLLDQGFIFHPSYAAIASLIWQDWFWLGPACGAFAAGLVWCFWLAKRTYSPERRGTTVQKEYPRTRGR